MLLCEFDLHNICSFLSLFSSLAKLMVTISAFQLIYLYFTFYSVIFGEFDGELYIAMLAILQLCLGLVTVKEILGGFFLGAWACGFLLASWPSKLHDARFSVNIEKMWLRSGVFQLSSQLRVVIWIQNHHPLFLEMSCMWITSAGTFFLLSRSRSQSNNATLKGLSIMTAKFFWLCVSPWVVPRKLGNCRIRSDIRWHVVHDLHQAVVLMQTRSNLSNFQD